MGLPDRGREAELQARVAQLEELAAQLQQALESQSFVEQAKGAVAARYGMSALDAFEMLRGLAQSQGRNLPEFCSEVIENEGRLDGMPSSNGRRPLTLHTY